MDEIVMNTGQPPGSSVIFSIEKGIGLKCDTNSTEEVFDDNTIRSRGASDSSAVALESMEVVDAHQLYPIGQSIIDETDLELNFPLLPGEFVCYLGRTTDGLVALTNFRVLVVKPALAQLINIPLGLFDTIECRDMFYLHIYCKDSRIIRCSFSNNDAALEWFHRISKAASVPDKLQSVFAFAFHAHSKEEAVSLDDANIYNFGNEVERLRFDLKHAWRICYVNENSKLCSTYPVEHIVPADITDSDMIQAMEYRSLNRFPSVVWRSASTGAVIARSGQPMVGVLGWRNAADERLVESISVACVKDKGFCSVQEHKESNTPKILIVDARNYTSAFANRGRGGGTECVEYYSNAEVVFMNMPNIHHIRKSLSQLRTLVNTSPAEGAHNFLQVLDSTGWLRNVALIIKSSRTICNAVDKEGRPALVHCSDGWDRTPQLTSLSQLLLDPYYRTIEGFKVLIEREWLSFGHKFADRCGNGPGTGDINERSPVFLQWVDAVYQVQNQYPTAFEFNETFLLKVILHVYSGLFGTFLCNSDLERRTQAVHRETCSLWSLLRKSNWRIVNYLYSPTAYSGVLSPSYHVRDLVLWSSLYCRGFCESTDGPSAPASPRSSTSRTSSGTISSTASEDEAVSSSIRVSCGGVLHKTKSCDDIVAALELNLGGRRLSDPNLSSCTSLKTGSVDTTVVDTCDGEDEHVLESTQDMNCKPADNSNSGVNTIQLSASTDTLIAGPGTPAVMDSYEDENQCTLRSAPRHIPGSTTKHMSTSTSELSDSHCGSSLRPVATLRQVDALLANLRIPEELRSGDTGSASESSRSSATPPSPEYRQVDTGVNTLRISTWPARGLDVDGCSLEHDPVQDRIRALQLAYETRLRSLERQLTSAKVALYHLSSGRNGADKHDAENWFQNEHQENGHTSGPASADSSQPASSEFDAVDESDARFTLWVPDHMATHCAGCQTEFWFVRRRHHCRRCGQVFCRDCSDFSSPVPAQNLFDPVRVCHTCFEDLLPLTGSEACPATLSTGGCGTVAEDSTPTSTAVTSMA